jgi:hypothetical protein
VKLEHQLAALCADHDLASLSLNAYRNDLGEVFFGAYAQANHNGTRICASDQSPQDNSLSGVLRDAIVHLNDMRGKPVEKIELEAAL